MTRRRFPDPAPRYLAAATAVRVRFQEVDALGVAWHGHYVTYFEDARNAFGRAFDFDYQHILAAGLVAPLVHVELDYLAPARFGDLLTVTARLHPEPAARLQYTYRVADARDRTLATGRTVQVFTSGDGELVLTRPRLLEEFYSRHQGDLAGP